MKNIEGIQLKESRDDSIEPEVILEESASALTQGMRVGAASEGYPLNYYPGHGK